MKTTIAALLFLLCATMAFGQSAGTVLVAPNSSNFQITEHPTRAISAPMPVEQNLLGANTMTSSSGEMPLWEAPSMSHEVPLGDSARELKKQHDAAPKARLTLEK
ncbi:MAG TPA: hypothetical protein VF753_04410 [Terriglobales bacterium]